MLIDATAMAPARRSLTIVEATEFASRLLGTQVSQQALRNWAVKYDVGRRRVGRYYFDPERLEALLTPDTAA